MLTWFSYIYSSKAHQQKNRVQLKTWKPQDITHPWVCGNRGKNVYGFLKLNLLQHSLDFLL